MITEFCSDYSCFGFSGSRSASSELLWAVKWACEGLPFRSRVIVGCAAGVDAFVREFFQAAEVIRASEFGVGRQSFARRSAECVSRVGAAGGLWLSFPSGPCPAGLLPSASSSRAFSGSGVGHLGEFGSCRWIWGAGCGVVQKSPGRVGL
jgi:hypothetical protein